MTIGEKLKRERKKLGYSLDSVAERTKIAKMFLIAIENDDLSSLPGGVYTRNFLREYAKYLNLDEDIVTAEYHEQYEVKPHFVIHQEQTKRDDFQFRRQRWRLFIWILLMVLIIAAAAAATMYIPLWPFSNQVENQLSQTQSIASGKNLIHTPEQSENQSPELLQPENPSEISSEETPEADQPTLAASPELKMNGENGDQKQPSAQTDDGVQSSPNAAEAMNSSTEQAGHLLPFRSLDEIQQYLEDNQLSESAVYGAMTDIENMFAIEAIEPVHVEVYIDGQMATRRFLQPGQVRFYSYGALNRVILGDIRRVNLQDRLNFFSGADQPSRNVFIYDFSKGELLTRLQDALKEEP